MKTNPQNVELALRDEAAALRGFVEAALREAGAACDCTAHCAPPPSPAKDGGGTAFGQSRLYMGGVLLALSLAAASAQEPRPASSAVEGIKGVKEEAVAKVGNVETGNAATSAPRTVQGVNKINGVETINGVKADGRNAVLPPPVAPPPPPATSVAPPPVKPVAPPPVSPVAPPPPPPPPIVSAGGTAVPAGGGSVGSAANVRAVKGVTGIDSAKLQNLEKALILKQGGGGTPTGNGRAAAAGLLATPLGKTPGPKQDGRDGFQEFEKLQNNGS